MHSAIYVPYLRHMLSKLLCHQSLIQGNLKMIASKSIPEANQPKTSKTVILVSLAQGLPNLLAGFLFIMFLYSTMLSAFYKISHNKFSILELMLFTLRKEIFQR